MRRMGMVAVSVAAVAGCVGGLVLDSETRAPVNGVSVVAKTCPTCAEHATVTKTQSADGIGSPSDGIFMFDAYAGDPAAVPEGDALAVQLTLNKPGYAETKFYHRPRFQQYEHGSGESRLGSYMVIPMAKGADSDNDSLSDSYEIWANLDPNDADTDDDGLPDGWEVLGYDYVDYQFYGANPRHKDIFVELDYEHYVENGVTHSAHLPRAAQDQIIKWFSDMNVDNPDGTPGIAIHFVQDGKLPKDYDCSPHGDPAHRNARLGRVFHYGQLCIQKADCAGGGGVASGRTFRAKYKEVTPTTSDDLDEENVYLWAMIVAHEVGHTYGLGHGGGDSLLCKPNYPSLMNYVYAHNYNGKPRTLRQTETQFSPGRFIAFPLSESSLLERNSFAGVPVAELSFLRHFGYPAGAHGFTVSTTSPWVDWNRSGAFSATSVAANLTARGYKTSCNATDYCASSDLGPSDVLRDFNDGQVIANYLSAHPPWPVSNVAAKPIASPDTVCAF